MKARNLLLVGVAVILSGWVGIQLGEQKLQIRFKDWRPAVVLNKVPAKPSEVDFSLFWTVWDRLNSEFVDKQNLDPKKMVDGAIGGMVAAAGDPYTVYLPAVQNEAVKEDLGGAFEGVGIQLGYKDNQLVVIAPVDGSPAKRAGVQVGDMILRIVDKAKGLDKVTAGMSVQEAVSYIRGKGGTEVVLTMARDGVKEPYDVKLMRETIVVKSVTVDFVGDDKKTAWVKLSRFGDRTQEEWAAVVQQVNNEHAKGVVLDLRNNPGGYLEVAVYIAAEFLQPGKLVVAQQYGDGHKIEDNVNRNGSMLKIPVVVLVNKGSASASEILAGALQDYKRAKVVGVQSFGKGSVQQPDDFPDGSGVHITVARWLRPSGDWIDKKGITPDVTVKWDNEAEFDGNWKNDPQLVKALSLF